MVVRACDPKPFGLVEPLQQGFFGQPLELRLTELLTLADHLRQGRDAQNSGFRNLLRQ